MSNIIQLLPESLANQIAAGEVIQRPASVVKELLENAVDAGADSIKLILKEAGKTLIQVVDNGIGMTEMDARMCFERHATSKISKSEDLFNIRTKGFRGEALASIAAIASVELKTKNRGQTVGTKLIVEASEIKTKESCQHPEGSSFLVKRLFFNVPARRKFLKSNPVELRHVLDEFQRISMAHPEIAFSCHHNTQEIYRLTKGNLRQRVVQLLGKGSNEKILPVNESTDFVKIEGFVGKPDYTKKVRSAQYLFVNDRFFKSHYFNHAIKIAYENLVPDDRHPAFVLFMTVDPATIDVNVHPTKYEIKFEEDKLIYQYLRVAVRHALGKFSITPTIEFESENKFKTSINPSIQFESIKRDNTQINSNAGFSKPKLNKSEIEAWGNVYQEVNEASRTVTNDNQVAITLQSALNETIDNPESKSIFQLHGRYIISQIKSGLMIIDQQTAHERILFEQNIKTIKTGEKLIQQLLFPETIQLSAANTVIFKDIYQKLNQLGFNIEEFGKNTFIVRGTPALKHNNVGPRQLIESFIQIYTANLELQLGIEENTARSLARCCAIKRGTFLQKEELRSMIDQLFACEMPYKSPFGRNCFVTLELKELEEKFNSKHS